jgi:hypothetical protein
VARGWESKAIEAQQEEAVRGNASVKPQLTREEAELVRQIASLQLSLNRITQQLQQSENVRHRAMLEQAKTDLESQIKAIEAIKPIHRAG